MGSGSSDEISVNAVVRQEPVLLPLLFAIVVDAVTEIVRDGSFNEILFADDLVLVGETMKGLWDKFWPWKKASEGKEIKVNLNTTKLMESGSEEKVQQARLIHVHVKYAEVG